MSILLIPATLGLAVNQINIVVSNVLASYLLPGSITYLYYSMRLIQFPIGIFGVAMGMAVLPALSEHAVKGDLNKLRDDFSFALRLLFFITVPSMAGLIALREPIVNALFQRGAFDFRATVGTSEALLYYSLGIWAVVGSRVVTATFYSLQDTRTPVKVAVTAMMTNIIMSLVLMGPLRHSGLALANSIASMVNFMLLLYSLRRRLGRIDAKRIAQSFFKICSASFVMGVAGWLALRGGMWQSSGRLVEKTLYLSGTLAFCLIIYLGICFLLKSDEISHIYDIIRMRRTGRQV
jgi:putative peptidoglycan lipid II flippase